MTTIGDIARRATGKTFAMKCPHCEGPLRKRSSRMVMPTVQQLYLQCTDLDCGAVLGADLTITHQISPSARPNPAVKLRVDPPRRRVVAANDDAIGGSEVPPVTLTG